jgi:hypothetical protein
MEVVSFIDETFKVTPTINLAVNVQRTSIYPFWNPRPWDAGHPTNLEKQKNLAKFSTRFPQVFLH